MKRKDFPPTQMWKIRSIEWHNSTTVGKLLSDEVKTVGWLFNGELIQDSHTVF